MKKIIFIILNIICFAVNIFAQSTAEQNLKKYWFYKNRLNNYFVTKGDCYGCSLPASTRNLVYDNDRINSGNVEWGDAPDNLAYYIGQLATEYKLLANSGQVLAAQETLEELFYAINQINYADACESHWPWNIAAPGLPDKIDGFCMRDYADEANLIAKLKDGMEIKDPSISATPIDGNPVSFSKLEPWGGLNDVYGHKAFSFCPNYGMSIDHHSYLLTGLALVVKLIPDNTNINRMFLDGVTSDFKTEVRLIAARLWSFWYRNNWRVKFPNNYEMPIEETCACFDQRMIADNLLCRCTDNNPCYNANSVKQKQEVDFWGQSAGLLAYPFTRAVEEIIGGNIVAFIGQEYPTNAYSQLGIDPSLDLNYDLTVYKPFQQLLNVNVSVATVKALIDKVFTQDFITQVTYNFIYQLTSRELYYLLFTDLTAINEISHSYILGLECISDIYHHDAPQILTFYSGIGAVALGFAGAATGTLIFHSPGGAVSLGILGAAGGAVIGSVAALTAIESAIYYESEIPYEWSPFYTTLHKILHPNTFIIRATENKCEELLDGAPCSGTYQYSENSDFSYNSGEHGWANKRRWSATKQEQMGKKGGKWGAYPGLDFMLFFNLYCLRNDNYVTSYQNYLDENLYVTGSLPYLAVQPLALGNHVNIIGVDSYSPANSNPILTVSGAPLNLRTFGKITSNAIIENRAYDEDVTAPLFNSTYSGLAGGILNFAIDWANNHGVIPTVTLHLTTPTLHANVEFKATDMVVLSPGFHAVNGVSFHAITTPPHCNSSGTGYERVGNTGGSSSDETATRPLSKNNPNSIGNNNSVSKTSDVTALNNTDSEIKNKDFNIIPNPNSGYFTLVLPSSKGAMSYVKITNMMGQTIFEKSTTENNVELNIEHLPGGVYSVTNTTNNISKTRKMVVH